MKVRQALLLLALLFTLAMTSACGGGGSSTPPSPPPPPPNDNGALLGSYFFTLNGIDSNGIFRVAGVFTADGKGNISAGVEDYTQGSTVSLNTAFTGTYNVNASTGIGTATLNAPSGATDLHFILSGQNFAYVNEYDPYGNATGYFMRRDTTAFSNSALNGIYVYNFSGDETGYGPVAAVGAFVADGTGKITAGAQDLNQGGAFNPDLPLAGTYNVGSNGRGTLALDNGTYLLQAIMYVIDANTVTFLSTDSTVGAFGRAEKQSGMTEMPPLSGGYVLSEAGSSTVGGIVTMAQFTADASGTITNGVLDEVEEGTPYTNAAFNGTYSMDGNGRVSAAIKTQWGTWKHVLWFVNPGRAFVLYTDGDRVENGVVERQVASFSPASLNGYFGFGVSGYDTVDYIDTTGVLHLDGAGGLNVEQWRNLTGALSHASSSGTYSLQANGRGTAATTDGVHLQFYVVSNSRLYLLQTDSGTTVSGGGQKQ